MSDLKNSNVTSPASHFAIEGNINAIERFGSGHINDTYCVKTDAKNYLLQRINNQIFTDVAGLMENTNTVLNHLKKKVEPLGKSR